VVITSRALADTIMKWKSYVPDIVAVHGVALVGWPSKIPFNPHSLGINDLKEILTALTIDPPKCFWKRLNEDEKFAIICQDAEAHAEDPQPPRKRRKDAGVPRKRKQVDRTDDQESDGHEV
jgi:hypothetical protein